jgi:hypothetical protein
MNAKEMFGQLGYKVVEDPIWSKYRLLYTKDRTAIAFLFMTKTYYKYTYSYNVESEAIIMEEHKAITKQLEELGWLDD